MKKELSIIIPCYNEAENIPLVLNKFNGILNDDLKNLFEIILVDNNSNDNTQEILKEYLKKKEYSFARVVFQPIAGYGAAVYKGLVSANSEFLCWTHADLQTDPKDTLKALEIIKNNEKKEKIYIKGHRFKRPFSEKFFEFGMSIFESLILRTYLFDINAQPNLFHKSFLKLMNQPPSDFSFDLYAYYLAKINNYKIIRFPVLFPKRIYGESKWNTSIKSRYKFIKRTIKFSFKLKKLLKSNNS